MPRGLSPCASPSSAPSSPRKTGRPPERPSRNSAAANRPGDPPHSPGPRGLHPASRTGTTNQGRPRRQNHRRTHSAPSRTRATATHRRPSAGEEDAQEHIKPRRRQRQMTAVAMPTKTRKPRPFARNGGDSSSRPGHCRYKPTPARGRMRGPEDGRHRCSGDQSARRRIATTAASSSRCPSTWASRSSWRRRRSWSGSSLVHSGARSVKG